MERVTLEVSRATFVWMVLGPEYSLLYLIFILVKFNLLWVES